MTWIYDFIDLLPKVELHVHLVGSASVQTVLELAAGHPDSRLPRTPEGLRGFYKFRDFRHFAEVYQAVSDVVRRPEDIATLVLGAARDLAAQRVRYVELTVTPYTHVLAGMSMPAVTEALDVAARQASERHGIRVAYIFDIAGQHGGAGARATVDHALHHPPERLVGLGLGGVEQVRAAHADAFRDAFRAAVAAGLHSLPHAGEMTGPETIWEAIDGLGAERIGHGISCLDDRRLIDHLRETRLPLEVCPTSNVRTGQVAEHAAHPLPRMLEEGLYVTLNSDDPPMFGTSLTGEYRVAADVFGLGPGDLADLARNAVRASFLDAVGQAEILTEIDTVSG
ncbi:aminodeoxyfutalosine deaminase [Thermomonospora echinospora]|uniref:Aminodeoxyfutalosine deaminase n=1 Tax=Thermomonospora echinospora TaxID=1992 RepID=A0A1H6BMD5_9ACTN|nr:adenosine deaminase [Thermomonospora echinospora]SEG61843.1 aminodeoxyfutalosine deaminase [Thermomonospora echinospora]